MPSFFSGLSNRGWCLCFPVSRGRSEKNSKKKIFQIRLSDGGDTLSFARKERSFVVVATGEKAARGDFNTTLRGKTETTRRRAGPCGSRVFVMSSSCISQHTFSFTALLLRVLLLVLDSEYRSLDSSSIICRFLFPPLRNRPRRTNLVPVLAEVLILLRKVKGANPHESFAHPSSNFRFDSLGKNCDVL